MHATVLLFYQNIHVQLPALLPKQLSRDFPLERLIRYDVRAICDAFNKEFSEAFSPFVVNPEGGIFIESFILKAIVTTPKVDLPKSPLGPPDPSAARKGERQAYWPEEKAFRATPIFTYEALEPGHVIQGPAVVEGEYTTIVVPPQMRLSVDERGLAILELR